MTRRKEPGDPREASAREVFTASLVNLRRISERARRSKLPLDEIAERSGWGRTTVRAWLQGERCPDDEEKAIAIVEACGIGATETERMSVLAKWRQVQNVRDRLVVSAVTGPTDADSDTHRDAFANSAGINAGDLVRLEESGVGVVKLPTNSAFYTATLEAAARAQSIRATHIRQFPPTQIGATASLKYFSGLIEWAQGDPECRHLRRIIGVPVINDVTNPVMLEWIQRHVEETSEMHNYDIRIQKWTTRGDGLNVVLMDDDLSFLAVSDGTRQGVWGGRISSRFVAEMLRSFYDQLWQNLDSVDSFLTNLNPRGT